MTTTIGLQETIVRHCSPVGIPLLDAGRSGTQGLRREG